MSRLLINPPRYRGCTYYAKNAVGKEAVEIGESFSNLFEALANVMSVQPRLNAIRELLAIYQQCSDENWDEEGSAPISAYTLQEAAKFLTALPMTVEIPEIIPEPTGAVGFEWRGGRNAVFVASVHGAQKITYAGLFGMGVTVYGSEDFNDSIPAAIITNLQRLRDAS